MSTQITRLCLDPEEAKSISALLREIEADERNLDQYLFLERASVFAQELPRRIRETFYRFKREERSAALHVVGNPVLVAGAGPTPNRHVEIEGGYRLNDAQLLQGLYGSLLGEAIGFTSQRNGSAYNNIIPLSSFRDISNSSSGSIYDFGFHVEDAFHPARADFIGLVCMRNDEQAPTTISCIDGIALSDDERDALFRKQFQIKHNPIHETSGVIEEEVQEILFGRPESPYVRINAASLNLNDYFGIARQALEKLLTHLANSKVSITLQATDCIFIDNFRCVHAREAYRARFGTSARWLSRVVLTNDLRKSITLRRSKEARAIAA